MQDKGLEPLRLATQEPKSCMSANSINPAYFIALEPKSGASASSATSAYSIVTYIIYASASDILPLKKHKIKTLFPIYPKENLQTSVY